jgi:NarL family two-component system response regulator LiaR
MTKNNPIRVLIVDDHDMLREGLATFLRAFRDLKLVGEASSGVEAVHLCQELHPDVVLMDLVMPELDGVSAIQKIHREHPGIKIIALSSFSEDELVRSALRAGATSYLLKNITADRLAEAIRAAQFSLPTLSPEVANSLVEVSPPVQSPVAGLDALTHREQEVLQLMTAGLTNAEIGQRLKISQYTIKSHVSNILSKLGVASRTEAVAQALKAHIVSHASTG